VLLSFFVKVELKFILHYFLGTFGWLAKPVPNEGMLEMQAGKGILNEVDEK